MQGFILKASPSSHPHRRPAGRVSHQAGSSGIPNRSTSTFNGQRVSKLQSHRDKASTTDHGKQLEDDFWNNKPLQGRKITPAQVLRAYGNDRTSLRRGFFLQKLCLQNILQGNRKVTPEQVIQEFNRQPGQYNKHKLPIARFKAECCLKGLTLNGHKVSTDAVVKNFQALKAPLELARFKEQCCLKDLTVNGQRVTPEAVVHDYQVTNATLELVRFKEMCCLKQLLPMNTRQLPQPEN